MVMRKKSAGPLGAKIEPKDDVAIRQHDRNPANTFPGQAELSELFFQALKIHRRIAPAKHTQLLCFLVALGVCANLISLAHLSVLWISQTLNKEVV